MLVLHDSLGVSGDGKRTCHLIEDVPAGAGRECRLDDL